MAQRVVEKIGQHPLAKAFLSKISEADILVISLAENNANYAAAFKNIFDWCSRINVKVFQNKKMFVMSTSPGGFGGGNSMALAQKNFPAFGADIVESFSLPKFYENFDAENGVIDPELLKELNDKIADFKQKVQ